MDEILRELLPLVSKPGRYTGGEVNSVRKETGSVSMRVALAFPDLYEIGISNLGLQILYNILNEKDYIAAERVYAPWSDMENLLRGEKLSLASLESSIPLADFDIVGFSLQHELTYTNLLNMLDLGGIPLLSADRKEYDPLVIAGGPSSLNPEPMADFIDAFLIGDGEEALVEICNLYLECKGEGLKRDDLILALSGIKGIYVPSLFSFKYGSEGGLREISCLKEGYEKAHRRILTAINDAPYPTRFILPNIRPIHDRIPLEVARGCSRFCRFCQAGYAYLPVRERSPERIMELGDTALKDTGMDEVALLSLSTGDYSCLEGLLPELTGRYKSANIRLSFPSLRVDTITPSIMDEIKKVRSGGFTIAPEAGSQRLRDLINKSITEEQILDTVREISMAGWQSVKLYFMIGLPTETREDIDEIVSLSRAILKAGRKAGGLKKVTVSISTFIPKPHTPFQWERQNAAEETREKLAYLKKELRDRNISLKWQEPEMSILEGLFSRGDRRLGKSILKAFEAGCRFDGWSDMIDFPLWDRILEECGIIIESYLRRRGTKDILPWDPVDTGVEKSFLISELNKAFECKITEDCRFARCSVCGVCDHRIVKIELFSEEPNPVMGVRTEGTSPVRSRLRVRYAKRAGARFLGHIDTMHAIIRMLRRAGLPLAYSAGFHPSPKVSFSSPIPLGTESLAEYFDVEVKGLLPPESFIARIKAAPQEGFSIVEVCTLPPKALSLTESVEEERYVVTFPHGKRSVKLLKSCVGQFVAAGEWPVFKSTKKGEKRFNLKDEVSHISILPHGEIGIILAAKGGRRVKAEDALAFIVNLSKDEKKGLKVLKTDTVFAGLTMAKAECG